MKNKFNYLISVTLIVSNAKRNQVCWIEKWWMVLLIPPALSQKLVLISQPMAMLLESKRILLVVEILSRFGFYVNVFVNQTSTSMKRRGKTNREEKSAINRFSINLGAPCDLWCIHVHIHVQYIWSRHMKRSNMVKRVQRHHWLEHARRISDVKNDFLHDCTRIFSFNIEFEIRMATIRSGSSKIRQFIKVTLICNGHCAHCNIHPAVNWVLKSSIRILAINFYLIKNLLNSMRYEKCDAMWQKHGRLLDEREINSNLSVSNMSILSKWLNVMKKIATHV